MHVKSMSAVVTLVAAFALLPGVPASAAPGAVRTGPPPRPLTTLGGPASAAVAVNVRGDVIGYATDRAGARRPVVWRSAGLPLDLGPTVGTVTAVNDLGDVVGTAAQVGSDDPPGYLWRAGRLTYLRNGDDLVSPAAVNNRDQVVGQVTDRATGVSAAFIYDRGRLTLLSSLPGWESTALELNDRGQVLGYLSNLTTGEFRAVLWTGGARVELGTAGGSTNVPRALNGRGDVLGTIDDPTVGGAVRPYRYRNGTITDLLGRGDPRQADAFAINSAGTVVGQIEWRPVRWVGDTPDDIGSPGRSASASVINDRGDVGGWSWPADASQDAGQARAFRWRNGATVLHAAVPGSAKDLVGLDGLGRLVGNWSTGSSERAMVWGG